MRGISREVLARDLAAQLDPARCKGQSAFWTQHEQAWSVILKNREADEAAAPALALCDNCPVRQLCAAWAAVDNYTGLAAGRMWRNGRGRALSSQRTELRSAG